MTGLPDLNRPAFDAAEKRLTAQGHFVINPHDISPLFGSAEELASSFVAAYTIHEYMPEARLARAVMDSDLAAVRSCDAIYLLRGWESSRGAKKELAEAIKYGLQIIQEGGEE
jgi:hypothetical protein